MPQPTVPTLPLNGGAAIPQLGLGTGSMDDAEAERAVVAGIEAGYRLFDTAALYGNERGVGAGLRAAGVPREELFVTTKVRSEDQGYERTLAAFEASVERLGLDYVDLYLIHWPVPWEDRYVPTWQAFIALREQGRVRAIGVSNFKPAHIERLVEVTGVAPAVNQIELHPLVARAQPREYDTSHGIVTQSWSPLGKGTDLLDQPVVARLAERHHRSPGQVVLRWHVQLGLVPIPKSADPGRIAANLDVFDFTLSDEDMAALAALDRGEDAAVDSDVASEA